MTTDWYQIPEDGYGQTHSHGDELNPYLRVNESASLLASGQLLGDENEEYVPNWSSDWRTSQPGDRGGAYNAASI